MRFLTVNLLISITNSSIFLKMKVLKLHPKMTAATKNVHFLISLTYSYFNLYNLNFQKFSKGKSINKYN